MVLKPKREASKLFCRLFMSFGPRIRLTRCKIYAMLCRPTDLNNWLIPGNGWKQDKGLKMPENMLDPSGSDPLFVAEAWMNDGKEVAIATVIETWGSAPRGIGSHLVIDEHGNFHGSVSGGCVEGDVITQAIDVIATGNPKVLEFGVADEMAWRVGLSCGGRIRVYLERVG